MEDNTYIFLSVGFIVVVLIGALVFSFNQGTIDRFWTSLNKDKITAKDEVYQTGSVRVYKFKDGETSCYVADKQGQSVGIYCK